MLDHAPTIVTGDPQTPPDEIIDALFCSSSEAMTEIPDDCVALMVTSPPYNVGKDYDDDLSLAEYLDLLHQRRQSGSQAIPTPEPPRRRDPAGSGTAAAR
jgi:hypothetical protein